jgi:ubiquinone/menaquinone biosynthesis C-methylase UbiE
VLGIDASANMLQLASDVTKDYPNFSLKQADVLTMNFSAQFDYVVSFWCLQWAQDIQKAFDHIIQALKPGGKIMALFPAGDDPFIMSYYAIKASGQFPALEHFKAPVDYSRLTDLAEQLKSTSAKKLDVALYRQSIVLPSLDVFRKFLNGIAFFQGQIPEAEIKQMNEAMVAYFAEECRSKYQGTYQFNLTMYLVTGEK